MIPLVIVGAGSAGKLFRQVVEDINQEQKTFDFLGFLDDEKTGPAIVGRTRELPKMLTHYVLAVNNSLRRQYLDTQITNGRAATLIHPTARIGDDVILGPGSVLAHNAVITTTATAGPHSHLNVGASIHQGSVCGPFLTLGPKATVCGDCVVGPNVEMGSGATIVNLLHVASETKIGAGATVVRNITEGGNVWAGVPARRIK